MLLDESMDPYVAIQGLTHVINTIIPFHTSEKRSVHFQMNAWLGLINIVYA